MIVIQSETDKTKIYAIQWNNLSAFENMLLIKFKQLQWIILTNLSFKSALYLWCWFGINFSWSTETQATPKAQTPWTFPVFRIIVATMVTFMHRKFKKTVLKDFSLYIFLFRTICNLLYILKNCKCLMQSFLRNFTFIIRFQRRS